VESVRLTYHAIDRAKERMGIGRKSLMRMAEKARKLGIPTKAFRGAFRRYLEDISLKNETVAEFRVYGQYIYLFSSEGVLVTIYYVPNEFKSAVARKRGDQDGLF